MSLAGKKILCLDDEIAPALSRAVRALGGEAFPAWSIASARSLVFDGGIVFDAAIVDLLLHNGNGADFIRELQITFGTPCVLTSGADLRISGLEGLNGVVFLAKPFEVEALEVAIREATWRAPTHPCPPPESDTPTRPG